MLAIFDRSNNMRFFQAITTLEKWCADNGKACARVGPDALPNLSEQGFTALYCVVGHDLAYLDGLDPRIKLIIDHDIVDPKVRFRNDDVLTDRPVAFRRAFGEATDYAPELQVPYVHYPALPEAWEAAANARDVLIFDLHRWLPTEAHFSFLALMQAIGRRHNLHSQKLGRRLFLYMTGLIRADLYHATTESFQHFNNLYHDPDAFRAALASGTSELWPDLFSKALDEAAPGSEPLDLKTGALNPMNVFLKNVIPPLRDRGDFGKLFARAVGFVTDHGDIADQDVTTCLAMGIPVLTIPRSPWSKSDGVGTTLWEALRVIDQDFTEFLNAATRHHQMPGDGLDRLLTSGPLEPIPIELFGRVYTKTWQMLFDWVETGARNDEVTGLIDRAPRWNFGMVSDLA
ncbi:MAG: hypothetical protein EpisKO_40830 [Epibacterium sp.]